MFSSVLIANRGEIACRIARTARRLGLRTIAVYSDADAGALHVRACDEAHPIGASPPRESYLAIPKLIEVARRARAECIHPGYGFLSENAEFAEAVAAAGMTFVGPPPAAIRAMGLKDAAKALMQKAGVPVVPGYLGESQEPAFLAERAREVGYPVLIKAVAGGGGKGMRRVDDPAAFADALQGAQREAASAFGDPRVLIEKYVTAPRHVEIQVFADKHGNVVHLFERDCSLQRRHQKVIEEAPAPGMPEEVRAAMGGAAIAAAAAVGYVGAGTVEFIADGSRGLRADGFWFMEMNTRLQVEHPVTEAITGLDLVEWQFRVAAGEALPLRQSEIALTGHAVEGRLYAEDADRGFVPSTGRIHALDLPAGNGIRVDTGVAAGSGVTPFYDPMIAKVIAHAETRDAALDRLAEALAQARVAGPKTNAAFLRALCELPEFRSGRFDTGTIDRNRDRLGAQRESEERAAAEAAVVRLVEREQERIATAAQRPLDPWSVDDAFDFARERVVPISVRVNGERRVFDVRFADGHISTGSDSDANVDLVEVGECIYALNKGRQVIVESEEAGIDVEHLDGDGAVKAPMHGKVLAVLVSEGETVQKGHRVAVIEAMKMEHALLAPIEGRVSAISVQPGTQVAEGALMLRVTATE